MKSFLRIATYLFIAYIFISILVGILSVDEYNEDYYSSEFYEYDSLNEDGVLHSRIWQDPEQYNEYNLQYSMRNEVFNESKWHRNNYQFEDNHDYSNYWGTIYRYLVEQDSTAIRPVGDSLLLEGNKRKLDRRQFANMLVSFVQDIPYSYILNAPCTSEHQSNPCVENEKFGLLSPVEFLYTLHGDCDTRTTLLYGLLNKFGYEAVVLISDQYAHAMLGVNVPSTGDYIRHKGRKFYFWETTNVGWRSGMLPNDMNNINYWKIALDYEY